MKKLVITVDTNDADYVTQMTSITDEQLARFEPLFEAIKAFKPYKVERGQLTWTHHHNWPAGEYGLREDLGEKPPAELYGLTAEQVEEFHDFLPSEGDTGYHTIESISVLTVTDEKVYL